MSTAVITGGGSGVGRALALRLVADGWRVAITGRRIDTLEDTARLAGARGPDIVLQTCDVGDPAAVTVMADAVVGRLGDVDVLVNAAGTNAPRRRLEELSLDDYHRLIATNLNGAYYCTQAFLPRMRARGTGTVINIVSEAGKIASPKAGPAYAMSKFGLAGFTQSLNAEERTNGIRACAIFPGDIDTPMLDQRPVPPDATSRVGMLQADDVAACAMFCITQPKHVIIEEMLVRPR